MRYILLIIIFITFSNWSFAQTYSTFSKDIDFDNIADTIYVDYNKATIVCKLSSNKFKKIESKSIELTRQSGIANSKNGFKFKYNGMRAGYSSQFRYSKKTKKIQLIGMSKYEFGNVVNDGSGESSVNLLTGDYIGNWNYYDQEKDTLISIPVIKTKIYFSKIYLNDYSDQIYYDYSDREVDLYDIFKKLDINNRLNNIEIALNDITNPSKELLFFSDSLNIGKKGISKIEIFSYKSFNKEYTTIKFYTKGFKYWQIKNIYTYETNALVGFEPRISDYNNDNYKDITFFSGIGGRGANEIWRLLIYSEQQDKLISIVNSENYPNLQYNEELGCIDSFSISGSATTTTFAKIIGDHLKTFASVQNDIHFHTIKVYDNNGKESELYKVNSYGTITIRHKNYKPLVAYE